METQEYNKKIFAFPSFSSGVPLEADHKRTMFDVYGQY